MARKLTDRQLYGRNVNETMEELERKMRKRWKSMPTQSGHQDYNAREELKVKSTIRVFRMGKRCNGTILV